MGCNKPGRTLSDPALSHMFFLSADGLWGRQPELPQSLSIHDGPGAVLSTLHPSCHCPLRKSPCTPNRVAVRLIIHTVKWGDWNERPQLSIHTLRGKAHVSAMPRSLCILSFTLFLEVPLRVGCISSSPLEDHLWAIGDGLPAGTEGRTLKPPRV